MLRQDLRGARRMVPMNIGNDAVNVWIANFSASCRACLYSSAAEHWSRKPGVRSSILLGGCLPFFYFFFCLPFYFIAFSFLQSFPQLSLKRHRFANVNVLLPWKKQLNLLTLKTQWASLLVFCTQCRPQLLPSQSEATPLKMHRFFFFLINLFLTLSTKTWALSSVSNIWIYSLVDYLTNKSS